MPKTIARVEDLLDTLSTLPAGARRLVAIAGAPGSGKSTLADDLVARLNRRAPGSAAVIPMDGFHLDDGLLKARGTLSRKGAPYTFDVGGLAAMLRRLRANEEDEIIVPLFDRKLEISRAGARAVPRAVPLLVVEGNYLLLDEPGWRELRAIFDLTISLDVPFDVLKQRLLQRWTDMGFAPEAAHAKAYENDLPNARTVIDRSHPADIVFRPVG
ncbi:nucleoside triphosphate hydrolase [Martelella mediterranea]|uniref:Nucleoside triphosphate hydrolase domain-containing protein n=1 Tax=Martelella mediterranea DSM 17316 TaxID=1122214 RepID=A0A1U9Z1L0_9HYPH|nr:nucleoside triphosphate hydrolase [Martelella mediterranea]AQZ51482.1 nucleoside triphosphate hydrolase domain-containing protein [Martelella mediterranea DSM 17316]